MSELREGVVAALLEQACTELAAERKVRRQLAEALRQIEFLPYSVTGDVEADLRRTKEIAHVALAASDALDGKEKA